MSWGLGTNFKMYVVHWGNCSCCLLKFTLGCPLPNKYGKRYYSAAYGHKMTLLLRTGRTVLRHSWWCAGAVVDNAQTTWKQAITGNSGLCGFSGGKEFSRLAAVCMICFRSNFIKYTHLYFGKLKLQQSILCHLVASHVNSMQFKFHLDFSNNFRDTFLLSFNASVTVCANSYHHINFGTTECYALLPMSNHPMVIPSSIQIQKFICHRLLAIFVGLAWNTCYNIGTYRLSLGNWLTKHVSMEVDS
jgi:hypothetical protein